MSKLTGFDGEPEPRFVEVPAAREFTFDVKLFATIKMKADSEQTARALVTSALDGAEANFGAYADGSPIIGIVSVDGEHDLVEINGEAV